jgi:uncharacterized membrane protein HdeD (DUF308 family)
VSGESDCGIPVAPFSLLFGLVLFVHPVAGALSVAWIIGTFAVIFGIAAILASLRLRSLHRMVGSLPAGA